jgi:hypothetical protein
MPDSSQEKGGLAVPFGRLTRFAQFGGMAANVAGGVFLGGVQQLVSGKRPSLGDLIMTPANDPTIRPRPSASDLRAQLFVGFRVQITCTARGVFDENIGPAHAYTAFPIARAIFSDACKDVGKKDHSIVLN